MNGIKDYWNLLKCGTKTMFKEFFNKETNKKQRANMWTFSRLIISFIIPILTLIGVLTSLPSLFTLAFITTGFGALTDFFDGRSARKYNSYSEYGKFLDQLVDKLFAGMIGISLSFLNPLFLVNIVGECLIATTNILYKSICKDIDIKSTIVGKVKQVPLFISLVLGFLFVNTPIVNLSILLTGLFQSATVISYVSVNEKEIKKLNNKNIVPNTNNNVQNINETKTIKNNNKVKKNISRKEQLINLKNVLNEIKDVKEEEIKKTYQRN